MKRRWATITVFCLVLTVYAAAEAPISTPLPKKARSRIVDTAYFYTGSPYVYGGVDISGFDCSGLVYRVFLQSIGTALPRTAREQYDFREPIDIAKLQPGDLLFFNTAGPISHVGIYVGEGRFVHAASEGPKQGVIESSLTESYWAKTFAGAGRIIPPAEYIGLIFSASLGPSLGTGDFIRGARGSIGVAYNILGIEAGLELRPEYDATLGDFRLPAVLALGIDKRLKVFAGPSLTVGSPSFNGSRIYEAQGGILATAGVEFTPYRFRIAGMNLGLTGELVYNRYVSGDGPDLAKDFAARLRAGLGLSMRWGI
jgi:probable lipoprotein NlpC